MEFDGKIDAWEELEKPNDETVWAMNGTIFFL